MTIDLDGVIHVVWAQEYYPDSRIYYASSGDGGNSWSEATAVSDSVNYPESPAIAVDDLGNIHVVWDERIQDSYPFPYEVRYTSGTPISEGISWSGSSELLSEGVAKALQPDIITQGDDIKVVFARRDGTGTDVDQYAYYTSDIAGSGWSEPINISHDSLTVHSNVPMYLDPAFVPCDNALSVYFHGAPTELDNEVIMSAVNTDGWNQTYSADVDNARAIRPSVICLGGKIHMVYEKVIIPNQDHQIYYMSGNRFAIYLPLLNK